MQSWKRWEFIDTKICCEARLRGGILDASKMTNLRRCQIAYERMSSVWVGIDVKEIYFFVKAQYLNPHCGDSWHGLLVASCLDIKVCCLPFHHVGISCLVSVIPGDSSGILFLLTLQCSYRRQVVKHPEATSDIHACEAPVTQIRLRYALWYLASSEISRHMTSS